MPDQERMLSAGPLKRIHVRKAPIAENKNRNRRDPVITVKCDGEEFFGHEVIILGPSAVVYSPEQSLDDTAFVWMETTSAVAVVTKDYAS
ncbi:MAG: hypothetical protein LPL29_14480 [Alphaproteobacteria bacterium]|nr:hypothetical protein [Alphaproteobacteria bacterium]